MYNRPSRFHISNYYIDFLLNSTKTIYNDIFSLDFIFTVNNPKKTGPMINETFLGLLVVGIKNQKKSSVWFCIDKTAWTSCGSKGPMGFCVKMVAFRKKHGHEPTGQLSRMAKAGGFSSVSNMLEVKGAENKEKLDSWSKELNKREALTEREKQKLDEEKRKVGLLLTEIAERERRGFEETT
ncbi:hypothetical protein L2E82_34953 [Cichorium intybus]|uniref:Uncharacterized protein n=1 Tax=Cichorium intybus TaxID=13427 RepID=A0ACB9BN19_CICIN|nr:hypothetical protein L2E82_34953 [Cichorium intybus]